MARIPLLMVLPLLLFLGLAGLFVFGLGRSDPGDMPAALVGQPAPQLALDPLEGMLTPKDADLRGPGVKIVNFWASWCVPCRVEHPNLMALKAIGIPIYGVNYKDEAANALNFLAELDNPYVATGQDLAGRNAVNWGIFGVPETFLIDGNGRITLRFPGPITGRVLSETILPAIEAAERGN